MYEWWRLAEFGRKIIKNGFRYLEAIYSVLV